MLRIFRHYIPGLTAILLAGDLAVIGASFMVTLVTSTWGGNGPDALRFALVASTTIFLLYLGDLYNVRLPLGHREVLARLVACQGLAGLLVAAIGFALPSLRLGRWAFFEIGVTTTVGLLFWRWSWLGPKSLARMTIRVLVVGTGPIARVLAELAPISARPFSIVGFIDDDPAASDLIPEGHALLGKTTDLSAIVEELHPDLIVVAQMDRRGHFPAQPLLECRLRGIAVEDWPAFYEKATGKILVTSLRPSWLVFADGFVKTPRTEIIKRLFDVTLAFCGLILAAPVMLMVAAAIKLESPGSILYRQSRSGQNGCVFILNKFRSMRQDAEKETGPVWAAQSDSRVTRVGAFLRRPRGAHELHRAAPGAARVRPGPSEANPLLHEAAFRQAGDHGLGSGQVPLRIVRRRRAGKAPVRSVLHQEPFSLPRFSDLAQHCSSRPFRSRPLSAV